MKLLAKTALLLLAAALLLACVPSAATEDTIGAGKVCSNCGAAMGEDDVICGSCKRCQECGNYVYNPLALYFCPICHAVPSEGLEGDPSMIEPSSGTPSGSSSEALTDPEQVETDGGVPTFAELTTQLTLSDGSTVYWPKELPELDASITKARRMYGNGQDLGFAFVTRDYAYDAAHGRKCYKYQIMLTVTLETLTKEAVEAFLEPYAKYAPDKKTEVSELYTHEADTYAAYLAGEREGLPDDAVQACAVGSKVLQNLEHYTWRMDMSKASKLATRVLLSGNYFLTQADQSAYEGSILPAMAGSDIAWYKASLPYIYDVTIEVNYVFPVSEGDPMWMPESFIPTKAEGNRVIQLDDGTYVTIDSEGRINTDPSYVGIIKESGVYTQVTGTLPAPTGNVIADDGTVLDKEGNVVGGTDETGGSGGKDDKGDGAGAGVTAIVTSAFILGLLTALGYKGEMPEGEKFDFIKKFLSFFDNETFQKHFGRLLNVVNVIKETFGAAWEEQAKASKIFKGATGVLVFIDFLFDFSRFTGEGDGYGEAGFKSTLSGALKFGLGLTAGGVDLTMSGAKLASKMWLDLFASLGVKTDGAEYWTNILTEAGSPAAFLTGGSSALIDAIESAFKGGAEGLPDAYRSGKYGLNIQNLQLFFDQCGDLFSGKPVFQEALLPTTEHINEVLQNAKFDKPSSGAFNSIDKR